MSSVENSIYSLINKSKMDKKYKVSSSLHKVQIWIDISLDINDIHRYFTFQFIFIYQDEKLIYDSFSIRYALSPLSHNLNIRLSYHRLGMAICFLNFQSLSSFHYSCVCLLDHKEIYTYSFVI